MKKLNVNDYSFVHLKLIVSLHCLVKCRSLSLEAYNNELLMRCFILSTYEILVQKNLFLKHIPHGVIKRGWNPVI